MSAPNKKNLPHIGSIISDLNSVIENIKSTYDLLDRSAPKYVLEELIQATTDISKHSSTYYSSLNELERMVDEIIEWGEEQESEKESAQEKVNNLEYKNSNLNSQNTEYEYEIDRLNNKIDSLEYEIDELKT